MVELMHSRAGLLAEIAKQREQLSGIQAEWQTRLLLVDRGVSVLEYLRRHPLVVGGVAAILAARRRNLARLLSGVWLAWKGYRELTVMTAKQSANS